MAFSSNLHSRHQLVAFGHSGHRGIAIVDQRQSTGKASRRDCQGKGIERTGLGQGLGLEERECQELREDSTRLMEVGKRILHQKSLERRSSEEPEFGARSNCPQVGEAGMHLHGEDRHSSEWARTTIDPGEREDTLVIVVVDRGLIREVPIQRNVEERAILVHSPTWVGMDREPVGLLQKVRQRLEVDFDHSLRIDMGIPQTKEDVEMVHHCQQHADRDKGTVERIRYVDARPIQAGTRQIHWAVD